MPNDFLERTLEDIVFERRDNVHEKGLPIFYKNAARQVRLRCGKVMDIFTWEINENILTARIIEFKREEIKEAAYWQALDYFMELWADTLSHFDNYNVEIILIGTKISEKVEIAMMTSNMVRAFTYEYGFDGVEFRELESNYNKGKEAYVSAKDNNYLPSDFIKLIKNVSNCTI